MEIFGSTTPWDDEWEGFVEPGQVRRFLGNVNTGKFLELLTKQFWPQARLVTEPEQVAYSKHRIPKLVETGQSGPYGTPIMETKTVWDKQAITEERPNTTWFTNPITGNETPLGQPLQKSDADRAEVNEASMERRRFLRERRDFWIKMQNWNMVKQIDFKIKNLQY
jgi:hypothetical protein